MQRLARLKAAEPWALEDLRSVSTHELLARLNGQNVRVDSHSFLEFAGSARRRRVSYLLLPDEINDEDPFYLVIFELWRRLLPEKPSLSSFVTNSIIGLPCMTREIPKVMTSFKMPWPIFSKYSTKMPTLGQSRKTYLWLSAIIARMI